MASPTNGEATASRDVVSQLIVAVRTLQLFVEKQESHHSTRGLDPRSARGMVMKSIQRQMFHLKRRLGTNPSLDLAQAIYKDACRQLRLQHPELGPWLTMFNEFRPGSP